MRRSLRGGYAPPAPVEKTEGILGAKGYGRASPSIEPADSPIQISGKCDPQQIRKHQEPSRPGDTVKPHSGCQNQKPQENEPNERKIVKRQIEKENRPEKVYAQLVPYSCSAGRMACCDCPDLRTRKEATPIRTNKSVQTTGKSHPGGESGGLFRDAKVTLQFLWLAMLRDRRPPAGRRCTGAAVGNFDAKNHLRGEILCAFRQCHAGILRNIQMGKRVSGTQPAGKAPGWFGDVLPCRRKRI